MQLSTKKLNLFITESGVDYRKKVTTFQSHKFERIYSGFFLGASFRGQRQILVPSLKKS